MIETRFICTDVRWIRRQMASHSRLRNKRLVPLAERLELPDEVNGVSLKMCRSAGAFTVDNESVLRLYHGLNCIRSDALIGKVDELDSDWGFLVVYLEGKGKDYRVIVDVLSYETAKEFIEEYPEYRLEQHDFPPSTYTHIANVDITRPLLLKLRKANPALYSSSVDAFLDTPHVLVPLFQHVANLSSRESTVFPLKVKKLAEQFRALLHESGSSKTIHRIEKHHSTFWPSVQGRKISFIDGGVANLSGMASLAPLAMRVGIYSVRPGDHDIDTREGWRMDPYIVSDLIAPTNYSRNNVPEKKRLMEASRYVFELLACFECCLPSSSSNMVLLHGPLINQFTQYDEGEPNFIPLLKKEFLERNGITQDVVSRVVRGIPSGNDELLWNQYMSVYCFLAKKINETAIPIVGVVERSRGTWFTTILIESFVADQLITESYKKKIRQVIDEYEITDDFLFGCILEEGEYITPVQLDKTPMNKVRERWREVAKQIPHPFASVIKTSALKFPFRVEMNRMAGQDALEESMELIFHTSRLLPEYAFPAGLDIVDKYAKIPDWLSRGVSEKLFSSIMKRAMESGDPELVALLRQLFIHSPRDFFYRPKAV